MRTFQHEHLRDALRPVDRVHDGIEPWPLWFWCLWWIAAGGLGLVALWALWASITGAL